MHHCIQGGHHLENLEKSGNFTLVREKSGNVEKVRENVFFACDVLPRLRWSQNKHSLTPGVLLSADDMSVMDCQRSKQKLFLPIHISDHVLFK